MRECGLGWSYGDGLGTLTTSSKNSEEIYSASIELTAKYSLPPHPSHVHTCKSTWEDSSHCTRTHVCMRVSITR